MKTARLAVAFSALAAFVVIGPGCAPKKPAAGPSVDFGRGGLKVSENRRFLVHADGSPFFYMGDTAWELFHRLNREEAEKYLENRRRKRFTVIQAVALAELDGIRVKPQIGRRQTRQGLRHFRGRRIGIFVRVQLDQTGLLGLLARRIGPQVANAPSNPFPNGASNLTWAARV